MPTFAVSPPVRSYVLVVRGLEPIWLRVTAVDPVKRSVTGVLQADTLSAGLSSGDSLTVGYDDVIAQRAAAPSAQPQAGKPARPMGDNSGPMRARFTD